MHHPHRIHHHFVDHHPRSRAMFVGAVLRFAGQSMVAIFLFIYCYQLGFKLEVLLAYMIWLSLVCIIANHFIISRLINWLGAQRANAVSNIFLVLFTLGLYQLESNLWHLFSLAILQAFAVYLYVISQHVFLIQAGRDRAESGQATGQLFSAEPLGYALGPVIGGLISWLIDPRLSIGVGVIILIAGSLLLFQAVGWRQHSRRHRLEPAKMWAIYRHFSQDWRLTVVSMAHAANQLVYEVWALWIGLILVSGAYGLIGITQFIGALAGFAASRWASRQVDRGRGQSLMRGSGGLNQIMGLGRFWAIALTGLGFKLLIGVHTIVGWVAYELRIGNLYEQTCRRIGPYQRYQVEYCICFENLANIGRGLFATVVLAITLTTTSDATALVAAFLVGTGVSLGFFIRFIPRVSRRPAA